MLTAILALAAVALALSFVLAIAARVFALVDGR